MIIFHKGSKEVTMRRFARAAIVAALFCTTGAAETMDMPANCQQQMQQCSLKVWSHNSFAKAGETQSVTFSNGAVLTCTSKGSDKPRNCKFEPPPDEALRQQCADLKNQLADLEHSQRFPQTLVGNERDLLAKAFQMTPAQLDRQISDLQASLGPPFYQYKPETLPPDYNAQVRELNFLRDLRNSYTLPELGATKQQMQARANKMVTTDQAWADGQQREYDQDIQKLNDQIAKLNCVNVPVPAFNKPEGTQ